ncbi:hypothetical protein GH714_034608 [Hevea brasiliensis]|uniref:CCT domain-containing protein n=1 Tax=Hevea brasiliensis TaxID=3981 RepID=A0A6A6K9D5_HEVBR|nr:hypothetical protein GH714_034608 [Hevea brasiliensis]
MDYVALNFENGDEIFGCSQGHTRYQPRDVGKDCILMEKNLSVTESNNGPVENAIEVTSSGQQDCITFSNRHKLFGKQIRYASRKARADTRKRVKGRFVKAGEAYDYDPLVTEDF